LRQSHLIFSEAKDDRVVLACPVDHQMQVAVVEVDTCCHRGHLKMKHIS
jgi:hypothetical protein